MIYNIDECKLKSNIDYLHRYGKFCFSLCVEGLRPVLGLIHKYMNEDDLFMMKNDRDIYMYSSLGIPCDKIVFSNCLVGLETRENLLNLGVCKFSFNNMSDLKTFYIKHGSKFTAFLRVSLDKTDDYIGCTLHELDMMVQFCKERGIDFYIQIYTYKESLEKLDKEIPSIANSLNLRKLDKFLVGCDCSIDSSNFSYRFGYRDIKSHILKGVVNVSIPVISFRNDVLVIDASVYYGFLSTHLKKKDFKLEIPKGVLSKRKCGNSVSIPIKVIGCSCDINDDFGTYFVDSKTYNRLKFNIPFSIRIKDICSGCDTYKLDYCDIDYKYNIVKGGIDYEKEYI